MNNMFPTNENEEPASAEDVATPDQNDEKHAEEETIVEEGEVENTGMDMGTEYKEDREQDLDDLVHSRSGLNRNDIPPPEEA